MLKITNKIQYQKKNYFYHKKCSKVLYLNLTTVENWKYLKRALYLPLIKDMEDFPFEPVGFPTTKFQFLRNFLHLVNNIFIKYPSYKNSKNYNFKNWYVKLFFSRFNLFKDYFKNNISINNFKSITKTSNFPKLFYLYFKSKLVYFLLSNLHSRDIYALLLPYLYKRVKFFKRGNKKYIFFKHYWKEISITVNHEFTRNNRKYWPIRITF